MESGRIDLENLGLRSGQAHREDLGLSPDPPVIGGETYGVEPLPVPVRVDISRTTGGFALRLRSEPTVTGACDRCLEPARVPLELDAREVDQSGTEDRELRSPYVDDGILDACAWLHDLTTLSLPDQILCRPDCRGICEECGAQLNDFEPGEHSHGKALDPRFAKLRELVEEDPPES